MLWWPNYWLEYFPFASCKWKSTTDMRQTAGKSEVVLSQCLTNVNKIITPQLSDRKYFHSYIHNQCHLLLFVSNSSDYYFGYKTRWVDVHAEIMILYDSAIKPCTAFLYKKQKQTPGIRMRRLKGVWLLYIFCFVLGELYSCIQYTFHSESILVFRLVWKQFLKFREIPRSVLFFFALQIWNVTLYNPHGWWYDMKLCGIRMQTQSRQSGKVKLIRCDATRAREEKITIFKWIFMNFFPQIFCLIINANVLAATQLKCIFNFFIH